MSRLVPNPADDTLPGTVLAPAVLVDTQDADHQDDKQTDGDGGYHEQGQHELAHDHPVLASADKSRDRPSTSRPSTEALKSGSGYRPRRGGRARGAVVGAAHRR